MKRDALHVYPDGGPLPTTLPVFPLPGALLLPGGQLPLNIFEPRYLNMTLDALGNGRVFGMIQPAPVPGIAAPDPDLRDQPAIYDIGCVGRIVSFSETDDGRLLINLLGLSRFRVKEELPLHRGYRRVAADYTDFAADLASDAAAQLGPARPRLIEAADAFFKSRGMAADLSEVDQAPDDLLITTLCMVCPLDPRDKQALLESPEPSARADLLIHLLQMAVHGTASGLDGAAH